MPLSLFEGALGGIGLFLLGMRIMSDGIRTVADLRIRGVFASITSNRFYSMMSGIALSLSLNSSSAAVIFTIGLINGGVLNPFQALSVLGGVLIGSSLTLHFPAIPYSLVATPFIFVGVVLKFFAHRRRFANLGDLLLGAGLLFLGLTLLESSFRPSASHPFYDAFNGAFFRNPLLAMFFGGTLSCFVQSAQSLATIISSLVVNRNVNSDVAGIMMLGGIVGVAAVGGLVSIGGRSIARRVAAAFLLISLMVILPLVVAAPYLFDIVCGSCAADQIRGAVREGPLYSHLAWLHSAASLLTAVVVISLSGFVSRLAGVKDDRGGKGTVAQPCAGYLDFRILNTPTLAIEQARKEITRMISVASFMFADTREILFDYDARRAETIRQHEQVLDSLNFEITSFLATLARSTENPEISFEIPGLLQIVTDLEHIGDYCEEILACIVVRKETGIIFTDDAMSDLRRISTLVAGTFSAVDALVKNGPAPDSGVRHVMKADVYKLFDEVKQVHFERISSGACPPRTAVMFNELTSAFMRIDELCWNIIAVQGRKKT